jgi:hypothetical protein
MKLHQRHMSAPSISKEGGSLPQLKPGRESTLLLEIIQFARSRMLAATATLNRSTCEASDRQLQALGAATLVFRILGMGRMAALVTDVPAIQVRDHRTKLKA